MVGGLGKRCRIFLPDGRVEQRTILGDGKLVGDTLKIDGRRWEVVRSLKLMGEETDYELHVEAIDE